MTCNFFISKVSVTKWNSSFIYMSAVLLTTSSMLLRLLRTRTVYLVLQRHAVWQKVSIFDGEEQGEKITVNNASFSTKGFQKKMEWQGSDDVE